MVIDCPPFSANSLVARARPAQRVSPRSPKPPERPTGRCHLHQLGAASAARVQVGGPSGVPRDGTASPSCGSSFAVSLSRSFFFSASVGEAHVYDAETGDISSSTHVYDISWSSFFPNFQDRSGSPGISSWGQPSTHNERYWRERGRWRVLLCPV